MARAAASWATSTVAERLENKAACVIALYLRRHRLSDISDEALAEALGVSRWTVERYLATVERIPDYLAEIDEALNRLIR